MSWLPPPSLQVLLLSDEPTHHHHQVVKDHRNHSPRLVMVFNKVLRGVKQALSCMPNKAYAKCS